MTKLIMVDTLPKTMVWYFGINIHVYKVSCSVNPNCASNESFFYPIYTMFASEMLLPAHTMVSLTLYSNRFKRKSGKLYHYSCYFLSKKRRVQELTKLGRAQTERQGEVLGGPRPVDEVVCPTICPALRLACAN